MEVEIHQCRSKIRARANVAATVELPDESDEKFQMGTPKSAWSAICRTWEYSPSSSRIVQDINRVGDYLGAIIANKGAAVNFQALRNGDRAIGRQQQREVLPDDGVQKGPTLHPCAEDCQTQRFDTLSGVLSLI